MHRKRNREGKSFIKLSFAILIDLQVMANRGGCESYFCSVGKNIRFL